MSKHTLRGMFYCGIGYRQIHVMVIGNIGLA